jgi:ABC-type multidrug transport system fused ATPase/permease subunit
MRERRAPSSFGGTGFRACAVSRERSTGSKARATRAKKNSRSRFRFVTPRTSGTTFPRRPAFRLFDSGVRLVLSSNRCAPRAGFRAPGGTVDTPALQRLSTDFVKARAARTGAAVCAVVNAAATVVLLLLLYLFVDLLEHRGEIPHYAALSAAQKRAFADEWAARSEEDRKEGVDRLHATGARASRLVAKDDKELKPHNTGKADAHPSLSEWEQKWRAGVYLALRDRVSRAAADAWLPPVVPVSRVGAVPAPTEVPPEADSADPYAKPQYGVLPLVVRERNRWTGAVVGKFADLAGWTWKPSSFLPTNATYLTGLFVLAFGLALARGVLVNASAYLAAAVALGALTRLRRAIHQHTARRGTLAMQAGGVTEAAELLTRRADEVGAALHARYRSAVGAPVAAVLLLALVVSMNFWLAVAFLALAGLVWVVGGQIAAHFRRETRLGERQAAASNALLAESVGLFRLVKCYLMDRFNQARVERQLAESARAHWRTLRGATLAGPLLGSVALLTEVALLYLGGRAVLTGGCTVAGLLTLATALVALALALAAYFDHLAKTRVGAAAAEAIYEFLERKGEPAEAADAEYLPPLTTRIEFRNVSLTDTVTGRKLLDEVTFAVPAGARVAVVGPDAAERRALVALVPRLLDPTSGEVRVEDKNVRWVTHESLRAQVATVFLDDLTFTDTVANNISCGSQEFTLPQVIEAAKLAHAHQFIERLPYGYETLIGGPGVSLTTGQRYRLALARALLRDPSILVIEEPVGPIDDDTLALLDDTLARCSAGRTIIFLAQRLSTLRRADRVFLLRNGALAAVGAHDDLWRGNDQYRRLQMVADGTAHEHPALKVSE